MLAKKYRPQTFKEIIGQDVMVKTLENAFKTDHISQGFLLSGPRGVGKTSTARLIAKALENEQGSDFNFDPYSKTSISINENRYLDVIEMDAASHTSVDDVRSIIDNTLYKPNVGNYKIYILDEAHMLSKNAFNALLKTLEEPPEFVKFILATTEIQKIPVTIASRCQRFSLKLLNLNLLSDYLQKIAKKEQITIDMDSIREIAVASEGSIRDALVLLEQASTLGNQVVHPDLIDRMLGTTGKKYIYEFYKTIITQPNTTLQLLLKLQQDGLDPISFIDELLNVTVWITKLIINSEIFVKQSPTEIDYIEGKAIAELMTLPETNRFWQILLTGRNELMCSPNPQEALTMVIVRLLYVSNLPTPETLIAQLQEKSEEIKKFVPIQKEQPKPKAQSKTNLQESVLKKVQKYKPNAKIVKNAID